MDVFNKRKRSEVMAAVRSGDTRPEMIVRRLAHRLGYRYTLHDRSLPGSPDLAFPSRGKVIFVHGCFWHRHGAASCRLCTTPSTRVEFWTRKFETNVRRDARNLRRLRALGWSVMVVWECRLRGSGALERLERRLVRFLEAQ